MGPRYAGLRRSASRRSRPARPTPPVEELVGALVAGDPIQALSHYLRLREQGERVAGLTYLMAQRLRDALAVSMRLAAGESPAEVRRGLRMPPRAAERFVADVARSDPERLRGALVAGGPGDRHAWRGPRRSARSASRGHPRAGLEAITRWPRRREARASRRRGRRGRRGVEASRRRGTATRRRAARRRSAAGRAGLLAGARVAVHRTDLDGLVDRADQFAMGRLGLLGLPLCTWVSRRRK